MKNLDKLEKICLGIAWLSIVASIVLFNNHYIKISHIVIAICPVSLIIPIAITWLNNKNS